MRPRSTVVALIGAAALQSCIAPATLLARVRPECLVLSICSVTTAEIAVFNPELTHPQVGPTKGPGHALTTIAPQFITKRGEACAYMILGVYSWGDASISGAVYRARVSRIATVDYAKFSVLGFVYNEFCTQVSGL